MAWTNNDMNRSTLGNLALAPQQRVLEIGSGPGLPIEVVAACVTCGCVDGIDPSDAMLAHVSVRNRAGIGQGRVRLRSGSVTSLGYEDAGFDRVCAVNSFQFWPDPEANLRALRQCQPLKVLAGIPTALAARSIGAPASIRARPAASWAWRCSLGFGAGMEYSRGAISRRSQAVNATPARPQLAAARAFSERFLPRGYKRAYKERNQGEWSPKPLRAKRLNLEERRGGDPGAIRTRDPQLRRLVLYPD